MLEKTSALGQAKSKGSAKLSKPGPPRRARLSHRERGLKMEGESGGWKVYSLFGGQRQGLSELGRKISAFREGFGRGPEGAGRDRKVAGRARYGIINDKKVAIRDRRRLEGTKKVLEESGRKLKGPEGTGRGPEKDGGVLHFEL
jgi:hypothetical protein